MRTRREAAPESGSGTLRHVLERTQMRMLPIANRASDYAAVAPACCNACRVCATSGAVGLIFTGAGAVGAFAVRVVQRLTGAPG
jgi:hypothetical protein